MKIFITGGSGLLGQYLNIVLSKHNHILTHFNSNIGNCYKFENLRFDLTETVVLEKTFAKFKPEVVIHAAAISDPLTAQQIDSKIAYRINVLSTEKIAELCERYKAKLIYTSTDLVYAGDRGSMLKEDSKLIPVSLYAETKLMGEIKIQNTFDNYVIVRLSLLYGFGLNHSKCHFNKVYDDLKYGREVKLFTDQFRTPLSLLDCARLIEEILNKDIKSQVLNLGGLERISRYELGERLCDVSGFDKKLLVKITMDDVPDLPKVKDVSLNIDKLLTYGIRPKSVTESLKEILAYS